MNKSAIKRLEKEALEKVVKSTKETAQKQKEYKEWAEKKFREIIKVLLIDFVQVQFNYPDGDLDRSRDGEVIFTVNANEKYHQMFINLFPASYDMYVAGKKEQLVSGMIHECAHFHTDRLQKLATERFVTRTQVNDAVEHLTEVMAEYIRRLIKKEAPHIYN